MNLLSRWNAGFQKHYRTFSQTALVLSFGVVIFGSVWAVSRFSASWGEFLWMQRSYDEPFYFWGIFTGDLALDNRLFGKILGTTLVRLGVSFDAMAEAYALIVPTIVFAAAFLLAKTWETDILNRAVWALLLVFSFDLLSGSSQAIYEYPPAGTLASMVGQPTLFKADIMSSFILYRRPEPQSSWAFMFLYMAGVIGSFTTWRPGLYRLVCIATPFLALIYVNVAIIALIGFGLLSALSIIVYRRPMVVAFALSIVATLVAFAVILFGATTADTVDRSVFPTRLPFLRPSIAISLIGFGVLAFQIRRQRNAPSARQWAAMVFLCIPLVTLNQQILTGRAIMPQNWELNGNYICIVIGFAMLMFQPEIVRVGRQLARARLVTAALWVVLIALVLRGTVINEWNYVAENNQSVAYAKVYREAEAKAGPIDKVVLPHLWDESMFVTRVPKVIVLGGYNWLIANWLPTWESGKSFEAHAAKAKVNFDLGFETLARQGITTEQFRASMEAEVRSDNCWPTLWYFFALQDCWPNFLNFTSPTFRRLPEAFVPLVDMYAHYLQSMKTSVSNQRILLVTKTPLDPNGDSRLFRNNLVAAFETSVRGTPVRAFAYLQSSR